MKRGDQVRVCPHGESRRSAVATVAIISENQLAIGVGFPDKPPFAVNAPGSMAIHPQLGVMLFAHRETLNGKPWGPWVEIFGGGHYEIEPVEK